MVPNEASECHVAFSPALPRSGRFDQADLPSDDLLQMTRGLRTLALRWGINMHIQTNTTSTRRLLTPGSRWRVVEVMEGSRSWEEMMRGDMALV